MLWQSVRDGLEMNDLQQKAAPPPPPPPPPSSATSCSSNGGLGNTNIDINNTSTCFSPLSSPPYPWGTWEDLLLASAVLKHGTDNWSTVSYELQARAFLVPPSLFSAEACKGRFWILNGRFSSCSSGTIRDGKIPWFEEVRKLRVAQLKRELERYDGSIGLLQKKLNRLKAERAGSETTVSKDTCEQHNLRSVAPDKVERCLQGCSAADRMLAEQPLGTLSEGLPASEVVKASCSTASPVIKAVGGLQHANLVPDIQESLAFENASCNVRSGGFVIEGISDQHLSTLGGCHNSDRINELATIGVQHEDRIDDQLVTIEVQHDTLETKVFPCSMLEVKMSSPKIEDVEHKSHIQNGVLSSSAASESGELADEVIGAQVNHVPAIGVVERVLQREASQYDSSKMEDRTHKSGELEDGSLAVEDKDPLCSQAGVERSVDIDTAFMESNQCQKLSGSSATHAGNMLTEDNSIDDSLLSASAMDLLRIAYADGTPVSTPETIEVQPVEPEKTEELERIKEAVSLCSAVDYKLVVYENSLIGSSVVEAPCKDTIAELESTEPNQTSGIQAPVLEVPSSKELTSVTAGVRHLAVALESEHVSGPAEISTGLSKIALISNFGDENMAEKADTLSQDVGDLDLIPNKMCKLELDSEFSAGQEEKSAMMVLPQEESIECKIQGLGKREGAANLERFEGLAEECNAISDSRACLEMVKEEVEDDSEKSSEEDFKQEVKSVATAPDVILPPEVEKSDISPTRFVNLLVEHPVVLANGIDEVSQVVSSGSQVVVEQKKGHVSLITAIESDSEITGLAFVEPAVSKVCGPRPVVHNSIHEADIGMQNASSFDSDDRSSIVEAVYESVNKQQESYPEGSVPDSLLEMDNEIQKASCHMVELKLPELQSEAKTINIQPKLEEGLVQMPGSKSSLDAELANPLLKAVDSADIDVLEEDGLLVDLMKLKGTDLTTLRKRKHSHRSGNSVEAIKDNCLPKERLDEILVNKQPKLSRSREGNKIETLTGAAQSKSLRLKFCSLDGSGGNLDQAVLSSNVLIIESHDKSGSKESAVEVFSTRRSRLKLRKLDPSSEEPHKTKRRKDGSIKRSEDMVLDVGDDEASQLEISGVISPDGKPVMRMEMSMENRLLPDLLILLECLRTISGHRFAPLFKLRPEIQGDARYRDLVKRHMDLNTVRNKLEEGTYSGSLEFFRDMMLIFSNALVFYSRESQEYGAARVLRESLIREMDRFLKKESPHGSPASMQAVKYGESMVLKDLNMSNSVTTSEGKRQGSIKSSCDHTNCEVDLDGEVGPIGLTSATRILAHDYGLGKSTDQGIKASSKALSRAKTTRTKAHEVEDDRSNMLACPKERVTREKHSRSLEDMNAKLSVKNESVSSSQGLKKSHLVSSRSSRDYTPKRESSDNSRSSKYSSGRQASVLQGRQVEPRKSLGGGRSSRSAQQSRQTHSRGNQSHSQPQKRART